MTTHASVPRLERTPTTGAVRGTVVVLGGRGESPEVYERFADRISVDGYRVVAFGDAAGRVDDVVEAAREALDATEAGPRVVVGSDSGVALAWHAIADGRLPATGVVSAGALTAAGVTGIGGADEIEQRTACPVHRGKLGTAGVLTTGALAKATDDDEVDEIVASSIQVPALVFHGENDAISDFDRSQDVYDLLPDARLFALEGGLHDVLNDVTHRSVAAEIVQFLERLRTPQSGLRPVVRRDREIVA